MALVAGGLVVAAAAVAALLLSGGGGAHHDPGRARSLPPAASLPPCDNLLKAPAGTCRSSTGEVVVLAAEGGTARLRTIDLGVTQAVESPAIVEPESQDTVTAPPGRRFVVLEATVANRLPTAQVFEPDQFAGRQTALYLYDADGHRLPSSGPQLADYSAQNLPATAMVPLALTGTRLPPPRPVTIPLAGELVFSYPVTELRAARTLLLFFGELGGHADTGGPVGVIRLPAAGIKVRGSYEGAGV